MTPRLNLLVFIFRLWIVLIFLASAILSWPFSFFKFFKSFSKSKNKDDAKPPKKVHWEDGETTGKHTGDVASLDDHYIPEVVSEAAALYSRFRAIGSIRNREEKKRSQEESCHKHYQGIIEGLGKLRILENEIQEHRFRERVEKLRIEYIQKSVLMQKRSETHRWLAQAMDRLKITICNHKNARKKFVHQSVVPVL
ncbi:hypothetical protein EV361DRAFT_979000 [Lentinula raphanica]|uniref:Uncharacterized protein n=1 Tax=Lentinula raphanica TaxID=153919 RepID=A0AA38UF70_9AGAR|nr:hypothetical protein F5878DRAFT_641524 [Lentinula raphanica]KAJ3964391.1 hypothetical protein EV361DRAFT_979000 [Lentinula raphanica]